MGSAGSGGSGEIQKVNLQKFKTNVLDLSSFGVLEP